MCVCVWTCGISCMFVYDFNSGNLLFRHINMLIYVYLLLTFILTCFLDTKKRFVNVDQTNVIKKADGKNKNFCVCMSLKKEILNIIS